MTVIRRNSIRLAPEIKAMINKKKRLKAFLPDEATRFLKTLENLVYERINIAILRQILAKYRNEQ